jgi:hypothetical protein
MSDAIHYVYGVTLPVVDSTAAPDGLDGAAVGLEVEGELGALVSRLDAAAYAPEVVEARTADVEWLGPRAVVHDRVLTWASDQGPVVPFPMFSAMFRGPAGVRGMLRERAAELRGALAVAARGREYGLRIYRDEATKFEQRADVSYLQMPLIATIDRAAFVPYSFTAAYQPIKAHPRNAAIDTPAGNPIAHDALRQAMTPEGYRDERGRWRYYAGWPAQFDYVVILDFGVRDNPAPEILKPLRNGSFFVLYENTRRRQSLP